MLGITRCPKMCPSHPQPRVINTDQHVSTARRTIQGYEAMHMIRKGQVRWVSGSAVRQQIQFINQLVEVVA